LSFSDLLPYAINSGAKPGILWEKNVKSSWEKHFNKKTGVFPLAQNVNDRLRFIF